MKLLIRPNLLVLLLLSFAPNLGAQTAAKIRAAVKSINALKLDTKSFPYRNKCGVIKANLTIYYQNGEVRKITDTGIGDDDKAAASWNYAYYYQKGMLIFSYETRRYHNNETNEEAREETRQYFTANRLIKQIKDNKTTFPKDIFIKKNDVRYQLKGIAKQSDINRTYPCLGL